MIYLQGYAQWWIGVDIECQQFLGGVNKERLTCVCWLLKVTLFCVFNCRLNLSHLIDLFEQEKITLEMLGEMGHKHLSYVGVSAYGDRYTLLKGINQQDHYGEGEGPNGMQSVTIYTVTPGHSRLHQVGRSPRVRNKKKGDINHPKSTEWPIQCFYCGKLGHKQRSCWHFKTINQQGPPNKKGKREM